MGVVFNHELQNWILYLCQIKLVNLPSTNQPHTNAHIAKSHFLALNFRTCGVIIILKQRDPVMVLTDCFYLNCGFCNVRFY